MAQGFYSWSTTAATNASADASINYSEGMAPSAVNDSARALMARLREWGNDIAGAIVTSGTSTAYTVTSGQGFDTLAHLNGQVIAFSPHATNGQTVTLDVDSLGAKPLRASPGVEIQSGVLIEGTPYVALFNNSDGAFYLFGNAGNPGIPLGMGGDYWGSTTPSTAFAFPTGQAISRTTYSALFGLIGTTYGAGDGTTTFNLPDKTGRVSAMKESAATRLTSTYFGGNSTSLGATGGAENKTLLTANLPPYTPSGSVTTTLNPASSNGAASSGSGSIIDFGGTGSGGFNITLTASSSFSGTAQGGTSTPIAIVQPTIVCNYIIRVL